MKPRYTVALSAVDIRCLSIVALSLAVLVCPLRAQDYPTRPVRIVVTLPPASEGRSGLKGALASGDLRAIAMMGNERLSSVPDVPALVESIPNIVVIGWTVVAVPKGTPAHVITRLSADLRKVVADPQLTVRAQIDPFKPLFGDDLIRFIRDDQDRLAPLVQSLDKS